MERLTFEGNFCDIARCKEVKCPYDTDCSQKQVWERLKQYEDTKRTPEQIEALEAAIMGKAVAQITEFEGLPVARLRELAVADQEGRVVVLPCKRGDELWTYCNHPVKRVYSFTVSDVSTLNGRTVLNTLGLGTIRPEDIGKTVFLTREEAEKALAEMEGKKDG
jgi:hypothetical protein